MKSRIVIACFMKGFNSPWVYASVVIATLKDNDYIEQKFRLADYSHQGLIETLNDIWPDWTDADQNLTRCLA